MAPGRGAERQLWIFGITFLCGLFGGLFGYLPYYFNRWSLVFVVALFGGALISAWVAFFLLTTKRPETGRWSPQSARPVEPPPPEHPAYSWPAVAPPLPPSQTNRMRPVAPSAQRSEPQRSEPERQPVAEHLRLPLPPGNPPLSNGDATGWQWTTTPTSPLSRGDVESDLIAQCPRCGEFRLEVDQLAQAYAFRCRNGRCGNTWSWTPGTPWPPVVVRRNLPGGLAPGGSGAGRG